MQFTEQQSQESPTIVIFGGGLKKENATGRWRTTNFNEGDRFGVQGDRLRVVAGSMLAKEYPKSTVIALGGVGQLKDIPGAPAVADVIKRELIELGVAEDRITTECESGSTYQQLAALQSMLARERDGDLLFISNRYNIPRIQAMIEYAPGLDTLKSLLQNDKIKLASAEDIAIEHEPEAWQETIERAYQSEAMQKRVQLEEKGVREIREGTYRYH
jgi:hypothetical protein